MEGIEKNDFIILARQNGNTVSASRTVPLILRNRERFFILLKVLLFFFFSFSLAKFQNGHRWHQTTQQPGLVSLKLSSHDLLSEMQNVTIEYRGTSMPGAEYNLYGFRA